MDKQIIHIYGASGSGTTTLAKYISQEMGYFMMDTDDYYWMPTDRPYTVKRNIQERLDLMKQDLLKSDRIVLSGSLFDWGDELIPFFTLAVRLETENGIRMKRLKEREKKDFGSRIEPGGDMYEDHIEFMEWAAAYDDGGLEIRSKAKHDEWEKLLTCPVIRLNGNSRLENNLEVVRQAVMLTQD